MIGVGDHVVCVRGNRGDGRPRITGPIPEIGTVYQVLALRPYITGLWLLLDGAPDCLEGQINWGPLWFSERFRKVEHDKREACETEFVTLINRARQPEKLPMTEALSRFGDVPESFVEAEREFERQVQELMDWVRSTRQVQS